MFDNPGFAAGSIQAEEIVSIYHDESEVLDVANGSV